jgi:hypothetical protein
MTTRAEALARRIEMEQSIVRHLVRELKKAGYLPSQVWDSEEYVKATTETQVLDAVFAVEDSTIHFDAGKGANRRHSHGVLIVLGNACDCISDYHTGDKDFAAVVDAVGEWTRQFEDETSRIHRALQARC